MPAGFWNSCPLLISEELVIDFLEAEAAPLNEHLDRASWNYSTMT